MDICGRVSCVYHYVVYSANGCIASTLIQNSSPFLRAEIPWNHNVVHPWLRPSHKFQCNSAERELAWPHERRIECCRCSSSIGLQRGFGSGFRVGLSQSTELGTCPGVV